MLLPLCFGKQICYTQKINSNQLNSNSKRKKGYLKMEIQILLNPNLPNYGEFQAELSGEINALQRPGLSITSKTAAPPPGTLGFGEILQFIIDNQDNLIQSGLLLTSVIQVVMEVLRRRDVIPPAKPPKSTKTQKSKKQANTDRTEPLVIIITGDKNQLNLPCTPKQASDFIKKVQKSKK